MLEPRKEGSLRSGHVHNASPRPSPGTAEQVRAGQVELLKTVELLQVQLILRMLIQINVVSLLKQMK